MAIRISHPVHVHDLELKSCQKPYTCEGCKEKGFGLTYRCEKCTFDLHEDCVTCVFNRRTISHDFFKKATFEFLYQKPYGSTRYCDGCGKGIHGFHYHCKEKSRYLHPCCANLERELLIDDIKFQLRKKVSSKCIWCKERKLKDTISGTRGWAYVSKCRKYQFHVYCGTEMVVQPWQNGCLPSLNLEHLPIRAIFGNRNGRGGNKIMTTLKLLFKTTALIDTIVGSVLGVPVTPVGLVANLIGN